jgi:hypothetical protein
MICTRHSGTPTNTTDEADITTSDSSPEETYADVYFTTQSALLSAPLSVEEVLKNSGKYGL